MARVTLNAIIDADTKKFDAAIKTTQAGLTTLGKTTALADIGIGAAAAGVQLLGMGNQAVGAAQALGAISGAGLLMAAQAGIVLKLAMNENNAGAKQLKDTWQQMSNDFIKASSSVLPGLNDGLKSVSSLVPTLVKGFHDTGVVLGNLARDAGQVVASPLFKKDIATIMALNTDSMNHFGSAGIQLLHPLRDLATVAAAVLNQFSGFAPMWAEQFTNFIAAKRASGELEKGFRDGVKALLDFVAGVWAFGGIIRNVMEAAGIVSGDTMGKLSHWLRELKKNTDEGTPAFEIMVEVFGKLKEKGEKLLSIIKDMGENFKNVDWEGLADAFIKIADALGPLTPLIVALANSFTTLINAIPTPVLTALLAIFISLKFALGIIKLVSSLAGAFRDLVHAFRVIQPILHWIAAFIRLQALATVIRIAFWTVVSVIGTVIGSITAVAAIIIAAVLAVIAIIVLLVIYWEETWRQIKNIAGTIWRWLQMGWDVFLNALKEIWNTVFAPFTDTWNAFWELITGIASTIWDIMQIGWDTFLNVMKTIWETVSGIVMAAWNAFWEIISTVASGIWQGMQSAWDTFLNVIKDIWNIFVDIFMGRWGEVWDGIKQLASDIWQGILDLWRIFCDTLKGVWEAFSGFFVEAFNILWNGIKEIVDTIWSGIRAAWDVLWAGVIEAWHSFTGVFTAFFNDFWTLLKDTVSVIWNAMQAAWDAVCNTFITVWQAVAEFFNEVWDAFWEAISAVARQIWDTLKEAWNNHWEAFKVIWNAFTGFILGVWNGFWEGLKAVASAIWQGMQAAWDALCNFFISIWNVVSGALRGAWDSVWNAIKNAAQVVWDAIRSAWETVLNALRSAADTVLNALRSAWETAWNAIRSTGETVWNALRTAWETVLNALRSAAETALNALRSAWDTAWNAIKAVGETIWNAIRAAWEAVLNGLRSAWDSFYGWITGAWNTFWDLAGRIFNQVKDTAIRIWNELWTALQNAWNTFSGWITGAWQAFWDLVGRIFNQVKDTAVRIWEETWAALRSAWDTFSGWITGAWQAFWDLVGSVFNNVKDTVTRIWGEVWDWCRTRWEDFSGWITGAFETLVRTLGDIWNGIKEAVAVPIRFVVNVIYNDGIRPIVNAVVSFVGGGDNALPEGHVAANGGIFNSAADGFLPKQATIQQGRGRGLFQWAESETGGEAFIPLAPGKRKRSMDLLSTVAGMFGMSLGSGSKPDCGGSCGGGGSKGGDLFKTLQSGIPAHAEFGFIADVAEAVGGGVAAAVGAVGDVASTGANAVIGAGAGIAGTGLAALATAAGGLADLTSGIPIIGDAISAIANLLGQGAVAMLEKAMDSLAEIAVPGDPGKWLDTAKAIPVEILKRVMGKVKEMEEAQKAALSAGGGAGPVGTAGVEQWRATALQAMAMAGEPLQNIECVLSRMMKESGGNPGITNTTDINAQNGVASTGLMQVIPPTFAAYCGPTCGLGINNPIANIYAALKYAQATYGSMCVADTMPDGYDRGGFHSRGGFALTKQLNQANKRAGLGIAGAANGKMVQWAEAGTGGEAFIPLGPGKRGRSMKVLSEVARMFGQELVSMSNGGIIGDNNYSFSGSHRGGHSRGDMNVTIPITVNGNLDEKAVKKLEQEVLPKMRMMLQQRVGRRP